MAKLKSKHSNDIEARRLQQEQVYAELNADKEMLRCVLPVSNVDLITYAVASLLEAKPIEKRAAEKLIEHFFTQREERKAFMNLVNAYIDKKHFHDRVILRVQNRKAQLEKALNTPEAF
jgi:hypothetical protein